MTKFNGDDEHDTAVLAVALERSRAFAAAKEAEPTEAARKEIARILAEHGDPE